MIMPRSTDVEDICADLGLYASRVFKKEDWDSRPVWVISAGKHPDRRIITIPGNLTIDQIRQKLQEINGLLPLQQVISE